MRIAVTGATGFIGSYLIDYLLKETEHQVVAISRSPMSSNHPRLQCRQADLFSLLDCEKALADCDVGFYLVHSMSPSARLSQGHFKDFDFILADNFAKAANKNNLQKLIYVSGLIPDSEELSDHLLSRLEVEKTLSSHDVPTITLRCGIVVGAGGSSFQMVRNLVKRLPIIGLPSWTGSQTQAIYIRDLIKIMGKLIDYEIQKSQSFDLGSPEKVQYFDLLKIVSKEVCKKNLYIHLPWIPRALSKLWVTLITGQSRSLVYPLVDSLVHPMVVDSERQIPAQIRPEFHSINDAIHNSIKNDNQPRLPMQKQAAEKPATSLVRSVQRLPYPENWTMKDVARYYNQWLPKFMWPYITATATQNSVSFGTTLIKKPLLILELSSDRTFPGRQLFYITGGILDGQGPRGRLEFRLGPEKQFFIAAIHNFKPRLPWYIYRYTQALIHAFVMKAFGKRLKSLEGTLPPESVK